MNKPQVVVFDLGKVLLDFDYGVAAQQFYSACRLPAAKIKELLTSETLYHYEVGKISREQFYQAICQATGFTGDIDQFGAFFADIFTPIEPMVRFQESLRKRGVPTYIFSNTNDLAVGHIRQRFPFFRNFDGYILSYEEGAMKPDPKIYEAVERKTRFRGNDILYIDDRLENVTAGQARGWQVILQETPEKTLSAAGQWGWNAH